MPHLTDRFADQVGRRITRRPRLALAVSVLGCLLLAVPALDLRLETDFFRLLPDGAPAVQRFRALLDRFGSSDLLFAVVESPETAGADDDAAARARALVGHLATAIAGLHWRPPGAGSDQPLVVSIDGRPGAATEQAFADHVAKDTWLLLDDAGVDTVAKRLEPRRLAQLLELGAPPGTPPALVGRDPLRLWTGQYLPFWKEHAGADGSLRRSGGLLVSSDGRHHVLVLHPARSAQDRRFCAELVGRLKDLRATLAKDPAAAGLSVHFLGGHVIADEDFRTAQGNALGNLWQSALGVLLLFAVAYRSLRLTVFIAITLLPATLAALGLARLVLGPELSLVSVSFATVLIGLGVDFVIHMTSAYGHELARGGGAALVPQRDLRPAAAHAALVRMARSILAGVLTTVVAFVVLAFSAFPGVRELGVVAAIGLSLMLVQLWVALPAFLARFGPHRLGPARDLVGLGRNLVRWRWRWAGGLALLGVATVVVLWRAPAVFAFDARPRNLRPVHDPQFEIQERLCARLGLAFDRFQVLVSGGGETAVVEAASAEAQRLAALAQAVPGTLGEALPARLDGVAALACDLPDTPGPRLVDTPLGRLRCAGIAGGRLLAPRWLPGEQPAAGAPAGAAVQVRPLFAPGARPLLALAAPSRQLAVIDRLAALDWAGVDAAIAALPDAVRDRHRPFLADLAAMRERIAQRRPLLPSALDGTPLQALVQGFCVRDAQGGAHAVLRQVAPDLFAGLEPADIAAAAGFADGGLATRAAAGAESGVRLAMTGVPMVNAGLHRVLREDFRVLAVVAALAVAALLALLMASPGDALTASATLVVGLAVTLAVMHLAGLQWNLVNLAVMPLILGIGIDAGIYFVNALRRQPRTRAGVAAAVADIAFPMIMTTATAIAGFAGLLLSDYRGLRSLGQVAIIGMTTCLPVALIGLPVWAALTTHRRAGDRPGSETP